MAKTKIASQKSLSDILYQFSVGISAIKVAKEALVSPRLDTAIVDQALTLAIDGVDDAYDLLDAAIVRFARPDSHEVATDNARHDEESTAFPGERPSARIRAFLARTRPLSANDVPDLYWEGRGLLEQDLALSFETAADYHWTPAQCGTVADFLTTIEPTEGTCFCNDPSAVNATCGLHTVLEFLADQVRGFVPREAADGQVVSHA